MPNWIWLPQAEYPELQACRHCVHGGEQETTYGVAEFTRTYTFERPVEQVDLRVSGDTYYRLYMNGEDLGTGPVCAGGDFLCTKSPPSYYAQPLSIKLAAKELRFRALVQLSPTVLCDYSFGHGGFYLEATVHFSDGGIQSFGTDSSWQCRQKRQYTAPYQYDAGQPDDIPVLAEIVKPVWQLRDSLIPPMCEYPIQPLQHACIQVAPGDTQVVEVPFDKIYAAYLQLRISGRAQIHAFWYEVPELAADDDCETVTTTEPLTYKSLRFHSIGCLRLQITNRDKIPVTVEPLLYATHYPITQDGALTTSDDALNRVYEVCKWTLKICRQTIHLDSPRHQEPLACTGDYYIESLMTAFTYGDMRLAKFDLIRTADWLLANNGVMFHTSYSLLWVMMLHDVYMLTADETLLQACYPALNRLLARFEEYTGSNGLLEKCPNYMFVDWNTVMDYNMHHPPKFLGQACLCMQYHGALQTAAQLYLWLNNEIAAAACHTKAAQLRTAINRQLYDPTRGLYIDGLPTPDETPPGDTLPKNKPLRHFSKYSNILAVLYGVCEEKEARRILSSVLQDNTLPDLQPYYMHFVFEALYKADLLNEYFLPLLERWKPLVSYCSKGLQEGWFAPDGKGDYQFDFSHAWGGTPAYQLPARLLGFEMLEPGFRKIRLSPELYGLEWADISVPTPFGYIRCQMEQGSPPVLSVPDRIDVVLTQKKIKERRILV